MAEPSGYQKLPVEDEKGQEAIRDTENANIPESYGSIGNWLVDLLFA